MSVGRPRKASVVNWIRLSPYTLTSAPAVTWIALFSTVSDVEISALDGSVTVVTTPGVTENELEKARPGIVTLPVVATSPAMNNDSCGTVVKLPVNISQNSVPRLSEVAPDRLCIRSTSRAGGGGALGGEHAAIAARVRAA